MKLTEIKTQLNKEIDAILPDVLDAVRKSPIIVDSEKNVAVSSQIKKHEKTVKRSFRLVLASILAVVIALAISLPIVLNRPDAPVGDDYSVLALGLEYGGASASGESSSASAAFILNRRGVVTGIAAEPEDDRVPLLLAGEQIVGIDAYKLAEKYAENAVKLGYIDSGAENCAVVVRIAGSSQTLADKQSGEVSLAVEEYFIKTGVRAVVLSGELERDRLEKLAGKTESSDLTIRELVLAVKPMDRFSFLSEAALDALKNGDSEKMRDVLVGELFDAVHALTADFADSFYGGNIEDAFMRIRHMIEVYAEAIEEQEAYIGKIQVGKDNISAWQFLISLDSKDNNANGDSGVLSTLALKGAYASQAERIAVETFAHRLKELAFAAINRCQDADGEVIKNTLHSIEFDFHHYIDLALEAESFDDLADTVRNGYESVMNGYLGGLEELLTPTPEVYRADIEYVTEQKFICQRGRDIAQARATSVNTDLEVWESRAAYEEWAMGVKSAFTFTFY
ncbi:MAG: hypothetical protein LBT55_04410 [Clostridiaceae bacterium]|nr:hypothetical protein [Clostridiaceae bacterium]